jgi:hypothetical protein
MDTSFRSINSNSTPREVTDFFERFEVWCRVHKIEKQDTTDRSITIIGGHYYGLMKDLLFPKLPHEFEYGKVKSVLLDHIGVNLFPVRERAIFQNE